MGTPGREISDGKVTASDGKVTARRHSHTASGARGGHSRRKVTAVTAKYAQFTYIMTGFSLASCGVGTNGWEEKKAEGACMYMVGKMPSLPSLPSLVEGFLGPNSGRFFSTERESVALDHRHKLLRPAKNTSRAAARCGVLPWARAPHAVAAYAGPSRTSGAT